MRWALVSIVLLALILVPFFLFEEYFNGLAGQIAGGGAATWSAEAAIVGLLASDVILPIPSSVVSALAGALVGFVPGTIVVWLGMTASCVVGYWLGHRGGAVARTFIGDDGLQRASEIANRYGTFAIVICRPVPVLAEGSVIFAGLVRASFGRFLTAAAASNLGVAMGYAAIGAFSVSVDSFLLAFFGSLIVPGLLILGAKMWLGRLNSGGAGARSQP